MIIILDEADSEMTETYFLGFLFIIHFLVKSILGATQLMFYFTE